MKRPVRLGAVSYLNVRPLVYGLDARPDLVTLRYDVPSVCASLLAEGAIDLGGNLRMGMDGRVEHVGARRNSFTNPGADAPGSPSSTAFH